MELVEKMLGGKKQALARLITIVERDTNDVPEIMRLIHDHIGRAYSVGLTGPPGGGKSTLVDRITAVLRKKDLGVGVLAIDPTSPFSGGAVLGDRIRMQQHYLDNEVFIRSMATRGSHGGLPSCTRAAMKLLDAFGKDYILLETVGVGQTELDIMETADTVVVVLVPEAGDAIQTMKAGLMEIADIFVVNKADRDGAEALVNELENMLLLKSKQSSWKIPVLLTQAANDVGIEELCRAIAEHHKALEDSGELAMRRKKQRRNEFLQSIEQEISQYLQKVIGSDEDLAAMLLKVECGELDPCSAASDILRSRVLLHRWLSEVEAQG